MIGVVGVLPVISMVNVIVAVVCLVADNCIGLIIKTDGVVATIPCQSCRCCFSVDSGTYVTAIGRVGSVVAGLWNWAV